MGAWGNLTPEEWEEEQAWQESHPDSAGERLMDAIDDAMTISWGERREREEEDIGWGDSSSAARDTGCSWIGWLVLLGILTFPFSLYFVVGLLALIAATVYFGGSWVLQQLDQLLTIVP